MTDKTALHTEYGLVALQNWITSEKVPAWLQLSATQTESHILYKADYASRHLGNTYSKVYHGGVVSSFLQACGYAEGLASCENNQTPKVISVHCNYLRPALAQDLYGRCDVTRRTRRILFLEVSAWQEDPEKLVAKAAVAIRLLTNDASE